MTTSGASGWQDVLPIVRLFGQGRGPSLRGDVIGGISACVVMIPSVIDYADLAGLPPAHGLYAALAAMLGYAVFASSRQVIAGPDAAITLLVASAVAPLAGGDPARIAVLSAATALIGGTIMLIAAGLRLAMIADFLSKPVLVGYITGAALILVSTQLEKVLGLKLHEHDFFPVVAELARKLPETHVPTFALGIGFLALLGVLRRVAPRVPGALVVFVLGIAAAALFDLEALGVKVVGDVPRGLPRLVLPVISRVDLRDLLPGAIGIALLTFPDGILLARAFANKNGYDVRPEQELRALATANLAAGLFHGFPVGASQSRTAVNDAAGGRTQLASLVAAAALGLFLLLLTPLLRFLPMVALGAIVVFAGTQLVELGQYTRLYRIAPLSFVNALLVTLGVLVIGVVPGIVIGVMLSLIVLLGRLARPVDAVLQQVPETRSFHDLGDPSATETVPGLIAYRFYAPLVFANADHFMQRIRGLVAGCPNPVRCVLVDVQAVTEVDVRPRRCCSGSAPSSTPRGFISHSLAATGRCASRSCGSASASTSTRAPSFHPCTLRSRRFSASRAALLRRASPRSRRTSRFAERAWEDPDGIPIHGTERWRRQPEGRAGRSRERFCEADCNARKIKKEERSC